jgi:hypothetical protein
MAFLRQRCLWCGRWRKCGLLGGCIYSSLGKGLQLEGELLLLLLLNVNIEVEGGGRKGTCRLSCIP